jgi:hypothetical protein
MNNQGNTEQKEQRGAIIIPAFMMYYRATVSVLPLLTYLARVPIDSIKHSLGRPYKPLCNLLSSVLPLRHHFSNSSSWQFHSSYTGFLAVLQNDRSKLPP